jgi:phosphoribosylamine--glycine ligase
MKILVIGNGGREHALCKAIKKSPLCQSLFCAPGNAGIAEIATILPIASDNIDQLEISCLQHQFDLVVIGPEVPLVLGLVDRLEKKGIRVFGPSQAASALEGSKGFMKDMVAKCHIPTAQYKRFKDIEKAKAYINEIGAPIVVKTDGLAAGKGVVVAMTREDALEAVNLFMKNKIHGNAGSEIIIEEFLEGEEASFFAISDGTTTRPLVAVQDHKRAYDGDQGPNTGGMGAYSPPPIVTSDIERKIMDRCILPLIKGMNDIGIAYRGILFAGLMIKDGEPKLLEYNIRFGDPECQVLLARLKTDLVSLIMASLNGELHSIQIEWTDEPALVVVLASKGYPGPYKKGAIIHNLDLIKKIEGVSVFHAGTKFDSFNNIISDGGRVLGITSLADTLEEARNRAYQALKLLNWGDGFYRKDIAWRAFNQ